MLEINKNLKIPHSVELPNTILMLEAPNIVIKPMDALELITSLKRLAKFKYPLSKKNRVYKEILLKNTIYPKVSLKNYNNFPLGVTEALVSIIWDYSVNLHLSLSEVDYSLNLYLAYEEIKAFSGEYIVKDLVCSENILNSMKPGCLEWLDSNADSEKKDLESAFINILNKNCFNFSKSELAFKGFSVVDRLYFSYILEYPLNISGFLDYLEFSDINKSELPYGYSRLMWLNNLLKKDKLDIESPDFKTKLENIYNQAEMQRISKSYGYPEKLLILVEGATEEKLLPVFAKAYGVDFFKNGVQLIAAGGKNQVVKMYKKYYQKLNLPILLIFDSDAVSQSEEINEILREQDRMFVISDGEFEDILPVELIFRVINKYYSLSAQSKLSEIVLEHPMIDSLDSVWKENGLGEFDKIDFARLISENICDNEEFTDSMNQIILLIQKMLN